MRKASLNNLDFNISTHPSFTLCLSVFLLGGYGDVIRRVMNVAKRLGMVSENFAFLSYELLINDCSPDVTQTGKVQEECEGLEGLLDIR